MTNILLADMVDVISTLLLSLVSFVGMALVYFLKEAFIKLENLEKTIVDLKIEIEKLKR